ncbi:hypothetical protein DL95DRAFT_505104 [Leptodontidium sp. 2 PMI_412]|nr:hypothetical protein DL95DRAFT_505104 [Leptodontidium sp. 2 PMI_412]
MGVPPASVSRYLGTTLQLSTFNLQHLTSHPQSTKMTLNKCTICNKKTTTKCAKCKSAAYCSAECQKIDFPLHKLICCKLVYFTENNPRPADEYLSTHKLGILFPVESTSPELIWVKNTITFEEVGSHWEVWPKLNKHIKCLTSPLVSVLQDRNVEVYISDMCCVEGGPNECLGHLLEGYQWTMEEIPSPSTSGPVISLFCARDRKRQFRDVMVSTYHQIRSQPQPFSTISEHMGMTLRFFKCGYQRKVVDANNARKTKRHPFDSAMASILMINANPEESNQGWGWADIKNWDSGTEPTVLVTRSDKKPISARQVEVLIEYIRGVVQWAMESDEIDEEYEKMQEKFDNDEITATEFFEFEENNTEENRRKRVIEEYMKSDRFEKFIEKFKKEKLEDGDTTWADVVSPRAG